MFSIIRLGTGQISYFDIYFTGLKKRWMLKKFMSKSNLNKNPTHFFSYLCTKWFIWWFVSRIILSFSKIIRILPYCQKTIKNCKNTNKFRISPKPHIFTETKSAELYISVESKYSYFDKNFKCIKDQNILSKKIQIHSLYPLFDENVRVGGQFQNCELAFNREIFIIRSLKTQDK